VIDINRERCLCFFSSTTTMGPLFLRLLTLTLALQAYAACDNYGTQNGSTCICPPGVGGTDCSVPTCGGTLYDGPTRPLSEPANGARYGNSSACTCSNGWTGVGCNGMIANVRLRNAHRYLSLYLQSVHPQVLVLQHIPAILAPQLPSWVQCPRISRCVLSG
jgi:hypothetical protein